MRGLYCHLGYQRSVFGCGQPLLEHGEQSGQVLPPECSQIEPMTREDLTAQDAIGAGRQFFIFALVQDESAHLLLICERDPKGLQL